LIFVHSGCRAVVREYLDLAPVQSGVEGGLVTIQAPDAQVQFIGKSSASFPVTGRLVHRGWRVTNARLPQFAAPPVAGEVGVQVAPTHDLLAPAQVELS
jgi:hypothetical protein